MDFNYNFLMDNEKNERTCENSCISFKQKNLEQSASPEYIKDFAFNFSETDKGCFEKKDFFCSGKFNSFNFLF